MLPLASPYSGISCFLCEITSTVPVLSCPNAQKLGALKHARTQNARSGPKLGPERSFLPGQGTRGAVQWTAVTQLLLFASGISDFQSHSAHFDITRSLLGRWRGRKCPTTKTMR